MAQCAAIQLGLLAYSLSLICSNPTLEDQKGHAYSNDISRTVF